MERKMVDLCKCSEGEIGSMGFGDVTSSFVYTCNTCHKAIGIRKQESIGVEWDYWGVDNWAYIKRIANR